MPLRPPYEFDIMIKKKKWPDFLTQNLFRIKEVLSSRVNLLYSGVIFHTKSCPLIRSFNNKERRGYHPLAYMTVYTIYSMGVKPRKCYFFVGKLPFANVKKFL